VRHAKHFEVELAQEPTLEPLLGPCCSLAAPRRVHAQRGERVYGKAWPGASPNTEFSWRAGPMLIQYRVDFGTQPSTAAKCPAECTCAPFLLIQQSLRSRCSATKHSAASHVAWSTQRAVSQAHVPVALALANTAPGERTA